MYKTLRSFIVYGAGEVVARLITFLSFLILARTLSTADYGQIETFVVTIGLIGVVGAAGLNNALQAFYYSKIEYSEISQSQRISTAFYTLLMWQVGLVLPCAVIVAVLLEVLPIEFVVLLACIAVLAVQMQLIQDVFRLRFQASKYLYSTLLSKGAPAIVSVLFVVMGGGINGYLWGYALTLLLMFLLMFYLMRDVLRFSIHPALSRDMMQYGLPFVLVGLGAWSFTSLDRWLLSSLSGLSSVGEYAFAVRISFLVSFLSFAFGQAWAPMVFKLKESHPEDHLAIYADSFLSFTLVIAIFAAVVSIFAPEVQGFIFGYKFKETSNAILLLCFAAVIQATTHFTAIGISLSRKTRYFAVFGWLVAILSIVGNSLLIPRWGIDAAASMSLCSTVILSLLYFVISQREYPMRFIKMDVNYFLLLFAYIFLGSAWLVIKINPFESIGIKIGFLASALIGVVIYLKKMVHRYGR